MQPLDLFVLKRRHRGCIYLCNHRTLIFPEKSATKSVKRNSLIHRFPDIERTVLTEISWIFLLLPPILQ